MLHPSYQLATPKENHGGRPKWGTSKWTMIDGWATNLTDDFPYVNNMC